MEPGELIGGSRDRRRGRGDGRRKRSGRGWKEGRRGFLRRAGSACKQKPADDEHARGEDDENETKKQKRKQSVSKSIVKTGKSKSKGRGKDSAVSVPSNQLTIRSVSSFVGIQVGAVIY